MRPLLYIVITDAGC